MLFYRPDLGAGWVADVYDTSPVMSTYLVAVAVHDFGHQSLVTESGTLVSTKCSPIFSFQ